MQRVSLRRWFVCGVVASTLLGLLVPSAWTGDQASEDEQKTPLQEAMKALDGPYRKLRRQIGDASRNAESLKLLVTIQRGALAAMGMVPSMTPTLPEAERPQFILSYKRQMLDLIRTTLDVEAALLNNDNEAAKRIYRKLGTLRRKGHEQFQIEEEC